MKIQSARIDELALRLVTGEDVETALERAIEERLSRVAPQTLAARPTAMNSFFERLSRMPVLDSRPADEIIGYLDTIVTDRRPDGHRYVGDHHHHHG